ncbi:MAG: chemotaxis protein CheA [Gammaproteobacteria bacterium]|nr:chemotaxis protein CheA [Gammaproteobacteria bacterium]
MAIDLEDDILQDFLIEAGEILESLNEQLVDLEQSPEDSDLLNSIFRGFHTIKGGGSFLSLTNLVEVCHKSEDVFNLLRNREISLNAEMMDAFLRVLDEVNAMFEQIRSGEEPSAADPSLIQELVQMQDPDAKMDDSVGQKETDTQDSTEGDEMAVTAESNINADEAAEQFVSGNDEITDEEFENLLDALHGPGSQPKAVKTAKDSETTPNTASDDITDDEFEALLDELHGKGSAPTSVQKDAQTDPLADAETEKPDIKDKSVEVDPDMISDDEFEALLDDLHGKGKGPTATAASKETSSKSDSSDPPPVKAAKPATPAKASPKKSATKKETSVSQGETTVRVDTSRLDEIMNLVGELVLTRNRLNTLRQTFEDERVHKAISSLDVVTADLQTAVMKTRMQPVKKVFGRFPRVVRDLARNLNKEVRLELEGEETDLDKNLVEALADPLVHLVRNSVDHGVELPEVREKAGKDRQGKVILSAQQEGDHILLSIIDDGAGMDPEVLRNKVIEKELMDEETASRLSDKECFDLIFMPGLSTKEQISDVSGRGVGMDVVKTKITQLNGTIDIDSELGKGTQLRIKVPLTLAILPTLMVQLGSRKFALPLSIVNEIFELSSKKMSVVDGKEVVMNRGKAPPVFFLRKWLLNDCEGMQDYEGDPQVIMVQVGNAAVGFVVDQVIGQEEVVIKPLDRLLQGLPGMAGSTITGDGHIAIILDVPGMLKAYT